MSKGQAKPKPFHQVIGERLKTIRERLGLRQEHIALVARQRGLPWRRSLVAQLETGRRHLRLEEWLALPYVFKDLGPHSLWKALLGFDEEVSLTPALACYGQALHQLIEQQGELDSIEELFTSPQTRRSQELTAAATLAQNLWGGVGPSANTLQAALRASHGEAEQKGAVRLRVSPFELAIAAFKTWNSSLTDRREAEIARQQAGHPDLSVRALQAKRGHITRELLDQLRTTLGVKGKQKRRLKRGGDKK